MAVTITETEARNSGMLKVKFVCTSDSDGNATGTTTYDYTGTVIRAIFDPDAAGTQPTDAYDVVVNDDDGYDVLNGCGANLSNAANVYKTNTDGLTCVKNSKLAISASGMGEAKGATVILYVLPLTQSW